MSLPEPDTVRLRHMLDAAEQARVFCVGRRREDLESDAMLRFALVHVVTVFGEAATKVSVPTRKTLPSIPWPAIVGMRNRLVHAYFDVDLDVLWQSVNEDLPKLIADLRSALGKR